MSDNIIAKLTTSDFYRKFITRYKFSIKSIIKRKKKKEKRKKKKIHTKTDHVKLSIYHL